MRSTVLPRILRMRPHVRDVVTASDPFCGTNLGRRSTVLRTHARCTWIGNAASYEHAHCACEPRDRLLGTHSCHPSWHVLAPHCAHCPLAPHCAHCADACVLSTVACVVCSAEAMARARAAEEERRARLEQQAWEAAEAARVAEERAQVAAAEDEASQQALQAKRREDEGRRCVSVCVRVRVRVCHLVAVV